MSGVHNTKIHAPKHVSRACLECRSRHLKCGGQEPICERCRKYNRTCTYVKSHRGGSRKKGVSLKSKLKLIVEGKNNEYEYEGDEEEEEDNYNEYEYETEENAPSESKRENAHVTNYNNLDKPKESYSYDTTSTETSTSLSNPNTESTTPINYGKRTSRSKTKRNHKSDLLPCVKNGMDHLADSPDCNESCLHIENYNNVPPCMKINDTSPDSNTNSKNSFKINFHPIFNASKDTDPLNIIFDDKDLIHSLDQCYISSNLIKDLNVDSIISSFYNFFYSSHPFLPAKEHIMQYLDNIPYKYDLLLSMKIMGEGQTSSKYARDIETINFLVLSILRYIRQVGKDFISLQSLLLLAMISHISSLHDLSTIIREATVSLALEMKLNFIDETNIPSVFLDVNGFLTERDDKNPNINLLNTPSDLDSKTQLDALFNTRRTIDIPHDILIETMRKTFWELYYFDSISGTASGHTKSRLATQHCLVLYPPSIPLNKFDYKSRAEACKLVNDAISLNIAIQSNADSLPHLNHMRAALGNWEMKLSNPDTYGMPYLINKYGTVNDGVFEAIMLLNYARIFTHRPFSYLWRADVSKHPRCTDEEGVDDPCPPLDSKESQNSTDARKIIETRKTIDSANFLMKTLLDSDPAQTCKRTPFLACALAFSCLVHLSAYAWVESNLTMLDSLDEGSRQISASELDTYTEYIKLEIGSTLQISRHWSLSAKLITHISETLARVSPKLYKKVQADILGSGINIQNMSTNSTPINTVTSTTPTQSSSIDNSSSSTNSIKKDKIGFTDKDPLMLTKNDKSFPSMVPNYMNLDNDQQAQQPQPLSSQQNQQQEEDVEEQQLQLQQSAPSTSLFNYPNQHISFSEQQTQQNSLRLQPQLQFNQPISNGFNSIGGGNTNNGNDIGSNNNFMLEFNDLVSSMNSINQANAQIDSNNLAADSQDYGFFDPLSPSSDTGCDWVDKHAFQFETFSTGA
ncbi:hypothetical protein C6P40_000018 [Pichia californica]|uniref:Zn(2)-C6 fungal-type domain-containing protein n=1 Tax=Pichia californica TaxID=460514 RepID=A0A9P6WQH3_9ASCO|nr:hypothetical protein C6P42_003519 [[Candida] californica]KAG0691401.1 hypothetical protein C6P40_000018 [[Candida] californica]